MIDGVRVLVLIFEQLLFEKWMCIHPFLQGFRDSSFVETSWLFQDLSIMSKGIKECLLELAEPSIQVFSTKLKVSDHSDTIL